MLVKALDKEVRVAFSSIELRVDFRSAGRGTHRGNQCSVLRVVRTAAGRSG
jgi:hypothetical protein